MKRLALPCLALVALTTTGLGQNAPADTQYLENLQARIAALESRVKQLESGMKNAPAPALSKAKSESPKPETARSKTPATKQAKAAESPRKQRSYQIQEGDTISEIARMHGIPRSALMEANKMREGQQIYIGDQIVIPNPPGAENPASSASIAKNNPAPSSGDFATYTVKYGDTLSSISRKNGVSVAEIKAANSMKSDSITGGQKLRIPTKKGGSTTVASNNTGASPSAPPKNSSPADESNKSASTGGANDRLLPDETYGLYTVERGDTLFSLARDFFTSEAEIRRLNEMGASNTLKPGADLVVPTSKYLEHHNLAHR